MKLKHLLFALLPAVLLSSCIGWHTDNADDFPIPSNYTPVVMTRTDFENAVQLQSVQPVTKSGKVYVMGSLLFVNDVNKGFHVYDYTNAANPVAVAFINIPGATDVAIRGNSLYINQATDLVTLQYNETANTIAVTKRNRNVFPAKLSPDGFEEYVTENNVVVNWVNN